MLNLNGFRHNAPAFQRMKPTGLLPIQRSRPLKYLHISKAIRYVPHFSEPEKNEHGEIMKEAQLIKVEVQLQTKGDTYHDLERILRTVDRKRFFAERRLQRA